MKEMIQKNKGRLICSAFVMCIGMILGYTCENSLWVNGTFAVTYVVAMAVTFYDNRNRQQSDKVIRMVTWIVPGMTLLYNGIARWIDMGVRKENLREFHRENVPWSISSCQNRSSGLYSYPGTYSLRKQCFR